MVLSPKCVQCQLNCCSEIPIHPAFKSCCLAHTLLLLYEIGTRLLYSFSCQKKMPVRIRASQKLTESSKTVNEIAYELGFRYPAHFTRAFKKSSGFTPLSTGR
ncbi:MAG: helix-turn-helix domain-containing protein [Chitinophagaceae bacterium]|nr:helix-turn-helix domain-containing protein [Chitinophagaceae bacterium]